MRDQERVHTGEFKLAAVQRILAGANVCGLSRELGVRRSVLYRWRDTYRREGAAGESHGNLRFLFLLAAAAVRRMHLGAAGTASFS
jgi:transposase-like protein